MDERCSCTGSRRNQAKRSRSAWHGKENMQKYQYHMSSSNEYYQTSVILIAATTTTAIAISTLVRIFTATSDVFRCCQVQCANLEAPFEHSFSKVTDHTLAAAISIQVTELHQDVMTGSCKIMYLHTPERIMGVAQSCSTPTVLTAELENHGSGTKLQTSVQQTSATAASTGTEPAVVCQNEGIAWSMGIQSRS